MVLTVNGNPPTSSALIAHPLGRAKEGETWSAGFPGAPPAGCWHPSVARFTPRAALRPLQAPQGWVKSWPRDSRPQEEQGLTFQPSHRDPPRPRARFRAVTLVTSHPNPDACRMFKEKQEASGSWGVCTNDTPEFRKQ